jgi:Flp pilus assembly pilin Flp
MALKKYCFSPSHGGILVAPQLTAIAFERLLRGTKMYQHWALYSQTQSGQSMAEYALIVTLVAAAGLAVWSTLGGNIQNVISSVANCI